MESNNGPLPGFRSNRIGFYGGNSQNVEEDKYKLREHFALMLKDLMEKDFVTKPKEGERKDDR